MLPKQKDSKGSDAVPHDVAQQGIVLNKLQDGDNTTQSGSKGREKQQCALNCSDERGSVSQCFTEGHWDCW